MLNARFGEIARQPDAPFLGASAGDDTLGRTVEAFVGVGARARTAASPAGLSALAQELARVRQHGFGEAELDRAQARHARRLRARVQRARQVAERPAGRRAVRHFLNGEAAPGIEIEVDLVAEIPADDHRRGSGGARARDDHRGQPGGARDRRRRRPGSPRSPSRCCATRCAPALTATSRRGGTRWPGASCWPRRRRRARCSRAARFRRSA